MNSVIYFRNKIMQESYSDLLTDEQLLKLLNDKFKSGELTKKFIDTPLSIISKKLLLLNQMPFYKEEIIYVKSMLDSCRKTKVFSLEELVSLSKRIENLTIYINELYLKVMDKKNIFNKIKPIVEEIDLISKDEMPIFVRNKYLEIEKKLKSVLENKTFKSEEISEVIKEASKLLEEYNYEKDLKNSYVKDNKYRQRYKTKLTRISLAVTLIAFTFSSYKVSTWVVDNNNIKREIKALSDVTSKYTNIEEEYGEYLFDVDFDKLLTNNSDTIGYIMVKGTNINYPIVKTNNNDYYLNHSFNKQNNDAGWIFMDFRNDINNLSKNNIIYAHGRLDGSMFGSLRNTLNESWYEDSSNHIITIVDKNKTTLWKVFSVYKIKNENYYITTDFSSNIDYLNFIKTIASRSIYDFNEEININDKVLTLSTCYDDYQKTVVHAKLIKEIKK